MVLNALADSFLPSVIIVNENGEKRENNEFVNEN